MIKKKKRVEKDREKKWGEGERCKRVGWMLSKTNFVHFLYIYYFICFIF